MRQMDAGRELDAMVAERVMGWKRAGAVHARWSTDEWRDSEGKGVGHYIEGGGGDYYYPDEAWEPSTRIDHAWLVVEKMREREYVTRVQDISSHCDAGPVPAIGLASITQTYWTAFFKPWRCIPEDNTRNGFGVGETPALAICRAALSVGEEAA